MPGGRPLKYTPTELESLMNDYFKVTPKEEWTITGLALAIGTTRELLLEYKDREEFADSLSHAYMMVHNSYEIGLRKRGNAGDIFALKNFGWKDKNESEVYGKDGGAIDQTINVKFVNGGTNTTKVSGFIPTEQV